jgi:hypothetical protein
MLLPVSADDFEFNNLSLSRLVPFSGAITTHTYHNS